MGRMISTPEACAILDVRHPTLYEARKAGRLTAHFLEDNEAVPSSGGGKGYAVRWDYDEVLRYGQSIHQTPPPPLRPWLERAKCRKIGPAELNRVFFPEDLGSGTFDEAKKMCFSCPVRLQCLQWAVQAGCGDGMFGGAMPGQLRKFGKVWRKSRRLPAICCWCGEAFSPVNHELYCRQSCAKSSTGAGGIDVKNRRVS